MFFSSVVFNTFSGTSYFSSFPFFVRCIINVYILTRHSYLMLCILALNSSPRACLSTSIISLFLYGHLFYLYRHFLFIFLISRTLLSSSLPLLFLSLIFSSLPLCTLLSPLTPLLNSALFIRCSCFSFSIVFLYNDFPSQIIHTGIDRPAFDYTPLLSSLKCSIQERNLQPVPILLLKNIELYEMICVRHGLMVVGPTGGGKSANIQILGTALSRLKDKGLIGDRFEKTKIYHLNPKSIRMSQLYGEFDENTVS